MPCVALLCIDRFISEITMEASIFQKSLSLVLTRLDSLGPTTTDLLMSLCLETCDQDWTTRDVLGTQRNKRKQNGFANLLSRYYYEHSVRNDELRVHTSLTTSLEVFGPSRRLDKRIHRSREMN